MLSRQDFESSKLFFQVFSLGFQMCKSWKRVQENARSWAKSAKLKNANLVETLLDLTFFPGSLPIHEKPPNRSFSNREHAFSLSLPIFEFLNFYKTAGDGGVGRAGISGTPPGEGCDPPGTPRGKRKSPFSQ